MRVALQVVFAAIWAVMLAAVIHAMDVRKSRAEWITSAAMCWQQNAEYRAQKPGWESQ